MEFWERQEASKRQEERRVAFKERSSKSADRSKDRQAKEHAQAEGGTAPLPLITNRILVLKHDFAGTPRQPFAGRVTDAGGAAALPGTCLRLRG